jgi:beta-glucanase (GH16 family)
MTLISLCLAAHLAVLAPADDPRAGKKLVWSDEFSGKGLPDASKWSYEKGHVRNHEAQSYSDADIANSRREGGSLVIEALEQSDNVTSAALESKQSWVYGYFEVRAKIPTGTGTWPAIWLLGDGIRKQGAAYIPWPRCGEIDVMENVGFDPARVHFNVHTKGRSTAPGSVASHNMIVPGLWKKFHTYGLDWLPDRLDFYFDGKKVMTYLNDHKGVGAWPFDEPQFVILNLAIGGDWGGQKGVDKSIFPSKFLVDYVRVYKR